MRCKEYLNLWKGLHSQDFTQLVTINEVMKWAAIPLHTSVQEFSSRWATNEQINLRQSIQTKVSSAHKLMWRPTLSFRVAQKNSKLAYQPTSESDTSRSIDDLTIILDAVCGGCEEPQLIKQDHFILNTDYNFAQYVTYKETITVTHMYRKNYLMYTEKTEGCVRLRAWIDPESMILVHFWNVSFATY